MPANHQEDARTGGEPKEASAADGPRLAAVVEALRRQTGIDFSEYKASALRRRLERRMAYCQLASLEQYAARLAEDGAELDALADDLLIGVTGFFRDPEVFQYLAGSVLPDLLQHRDPRAELRIWSAGCATGEEAYSLALLARAAAESTGFAGAIKIFATDIQPRALEAAAQGIYGAEALAQLPESAWRRYFQAEGENAWRVTPELRRTVVFARHNLLIDPPFTRIDLAVCRNLLIYLNPDAQRRALAQLHFALRPEGLLLLGTSETTGELEPEFIAVERGRRLFRKQGAARPRLPGPADSGGGGALWRGAGAGGSIDRQLLRDYDALLKRHMPPGMLVDEQRRVLHWFGDLSPYLRPPEGRAEEDVLLMVREELRPILGIALHRSAETHAQVAAESAPLRLAGVEHTVGVQVDCIVDDLSHSAHFHIAFAIAGENSPRPVPGITAGDLESELQSTREQLHDTIVELQTSNERLDLANEELTAANEELQSTNEELKSVNEDLYALNAELEAKNAELLVLNRDYDHLLASTEVGTVFLDPGLNIRKFSPAIVSVINLMPQDIGRPIEHIAYHLAPRDELLPDLQRVLADGGRIEREIRDDGGRCYLKRVLPFLAEDGSQDGVVLTYTDITAVRTVEAEREHLRKILAALPDGVYVANADYGIEYVNPALERALGPQEGKKCYQYLFGEDAPCAGCHNEQVFAGKSVHCEWVSPAGRIYDLHAVPFGNADGSVCKLEIFHDITERKQAEHELCQNEARLRSILLAMHDGVILWDGRPAVVLANAAAEAVLGRPGGLVGRRADEIGEIVDEAGQPIAAPDFPVARVLAGAGAVTGTVLGVGRGDGERCWLQINAVPVFENGRISGVVTSFSDITALKQFESRLQEAHDYSHALLEHFPALVWRSGTDGRCYYFNHTWLEFTGRGLAEEAGEGWAEAVHPEDRWRCLAARAAGYAARQPFALEYRLRRHDGEYRWMLDLGRPFESLSGEFAGFLGACFDVTDRRQAEDRLRLAARVFENSGEAIMITDARRRIVEVNRAFTEVTGYAAEEVLGKQPRVLSSGRHKADFYRRLDQCLKENGHWQGEIWNRRKNGQTYPEWLGISVVRDGEGEVANYVGIFTDITEQKATEARLQFMAHHDALTGLPNRLLFRERFDLAVAYAQRSGSKAALLFLDLDRFKSVNDSLGHAVGDDLLRGIAKRLRECMRDTDTLCRHGGDEFLVVLGGAQDIDAVAQVAGKLLEVVDRPFVIHGQEISISLSIGAAIYPDDAADFDTLLSMADTAMYHAKEAGRNVYRFFAQRMNIDAGERLSIGNGLRRALARGEFVLHYQPQIDLASGRATGAEALIRWHNPETGLVPPGRFIAVAEDSGLIVPIGEWVLNEACRQAVAWQRPGRPELTVAVNLSAIQFKRGNIEQTVMLALERSGLEPRCLELELTESLLLADTENVLATAQRLKSLGIKLSIDDFGTGYSSLAYLKRFAVDRLKIDQSFVRDIASDPDDASIVRAIIQMARSLNLKTVSEGVEDERVLDYLRVFHCDEAQGYFFARPMPAEDFSRWLEQHDQLQTP